jgi:general secretion pathway protein F
MSSLSNAGMQRFAYRARDAAGNSVSGGVLAADETAALRELLRQGLTPIALQGEGVAVAPAAGLFTRRAISVADRVVFLQELGTLLQAGIALAEALPSLARAYAGQSLGTAAQRLQNDVKAGQRLSEALRASGIGLPPYALSLVEAGEASGAVALACEDAAAQLEHERRFQQELRNALIYPVVLIVAGLLAVVVIFVGVIPRFATLLRGTRADIPPLSRSVIEAGVFMQQHLAAFGLGLLALVLLGAVLLTSAEHRRSLLQAVARLPGVGAWLIESELARWSTLLGTLLKNRVGIVDALRLAVSVVHIEALRQVLADAPRELERGRSLSDVLHEQPWFPATRVNLIHVGEQSGQLPKMLLSLGAMQTEASRQRQRRLLALIEPMAILIIGAVVGFLMVSVMMAITSLNTAVQ